MFSPKSGITPRRSMPVELIASIALFIFVSFALFKTIPNCPSAAYFLEFSKILSATSVCLFPGFAIKSVVSIG